MEQNSLFFHFANEQGIKQPLFFTHPKQIVETSNLDEVLTKMLEVQAYVNQGYYAAGYVSYEAAPAFDSAFMVKQGERMPLLWFGIFEQPTFLKECNTGSFQLSNWTSSTSKEQYEAGFTNIKTEIKKGNTYQVNYTLRLQAQFEGDDFAFYQQLEKAQNSDYSAYLHIGNYRILSASPELFFHWRDDVITTKPMKGTVKRGLFLEQDREQASWLAESAKNQAENVMIVDLLRNDVSVIAENGSVHVPALFEIEQYPTVWQMTSTVKAKTKEHTTITDIFKALFPCGSITGAPKIKTMDIITHVEDSPREVYCGAIGYITPEREAIFNVPIRTVWIDTETGRAEYGAGGGITWDSVLSEEYAEAFLKAKLLTEVRPDFQLLESFRLENGEYYLFHHHMKRLMEAAEYFQFPIVEEDVTNELHQFAEQHSDGLYKVRLVVSKTNKVEVSGMTIEDTYSTISIRLADSPIKTNHPFVYFKTTNRQAYETFSKQNVFDVLLWNENEEITEFTNGNVVVKLNGKLYTPPVECGLLAGTFRKQLLLQKEIEEKVITKAELLKAEEVWFINSVRKWIRCEMM
ncbi:aminodeoxychorismate synthase component I [Peribacillus asahii]|uniref:aminodeoxychorismate synthase component I n=1 Tax=Peribacillus asahii TaxID=228899 RepID=UPI0037FFB12C